MQRSGYRRGALVLGAVVLLAAMGLPARAPATVTEQRSRLPPPAFCDDPIVGQWKAHVYYHHVRDWYIFTLDIRRKGGGSELSGDIRVILWAGTPQVSEPPPCRQGTGPKRVLEPARGRYDGGRLSFEGIDWKWDGTGCNRTGGYVVDRFSGTIDEERQEFQSVLNADLPGWKDVPTVFRRIRCEQSDSPEPAATPSIKVEPPPFLPSKSRGGCGC